MGSCVITEYKTRWLDMIGLYFLLRFNGVFYEARVQNGGQWTSVHSKYQYIKFKLLPLIVLV